MSTTMQQDTLEARFRQARQDKTLLEKKQFQLIESRDIHKASIEAKLRGLGSGRQLENFYKCGVEQIFRTCASCSRHETFYFSCNRKWCPLCNHKLGTRRGEQIRVWAKRISQPKHLVLTMRNFPVLTGGKIRKFQQALLKLRHRVLMEKVLGGCMSIEITNGGDGWHLHAHCLLDVRWLDMESLAKQWGELLGQEFGIVKIKDVRDREFVQEVAKYVAKGSELASWSGEQIWEFISAIRGRRFFFAFGSLRKSMPEVKRELASLRPPGAICECGCGDFIFETDRTSVLNEIRSARRKR